MQTSNGVEFPQENKIFSVAEFIALLNIGLRKSEVKIVGEVGSVQFGPTGHVYFTLKDEKEPGILNCIIWKSKYDLYGIKLEEGIKIMALGHPEIYAPTGRLSFISESIELAGEGTLKKQYDELKKKLEKEGLFAQDRKRPLPLYPQKIGLITSKKGAVLGDFLSNIGKFGFKIKMIDSRVEGQEAVPELLASIKTFRKEDIDLLAIIRGGGSMESLMPFNNELLVREIANFPMPVIVAIGHDKDEPLVDFVADVSVSTPSIVATTISQSWYDLALFLERCERNTIDRYESSLLLLGQTLLQAEKAIILNNPERQLRLGYSIASINGRIIRYTRDVEVGDLVDIKVSDGKIISEVKDKK